MEEEKIILPDNAFRELKEGEKYEPVMSPQRTYAEVNGWSVTCGVLMALQDNINKYEANVGQINVGGPKLTFPMGGGNGNRN